MERDFKIESYIVQHMKVDNGVSVFFEIRSENRGSKLLSDEKLYVWTYNQIKDCKFLYGIFPSYQACLDTLKVSKNDYIVTWYHFHQPLKFLTSYFSAENIEELLTKFGKEDIKRIYQIKQNSTEA